MPRIGETPCWNPACACADAPVHQTTGGQLSVKCHKCQAEIWARNGTKGYRDLLAVTVPDNAETAAQPARAAIKKAAAPQPEIPASAPPAPMRRSAQPFDLGQV